MSRGVNKVILIGNLGDEPTFRQTTTGTSVANASLCTSESFRDAQGNVSERSEWHRLVFWGRLAEIVRDYCHKGSQIYVDGKIQSRQYEDKEGIKRVAYEIVVNEMQLLGSKGDAANKQSSSYSNGSQSNSYGNGNSYGHGNSYNQQSFGNNQSYGNMPQRSYKPKNGQNNVPIDDDHPF